MKNIVQYAAVLCLCVLWLSSPLATAGHAAQDDSAKSPAKAAPAKATAPKASTKDAPAKAKAATVKKGGESEESIKAKLDSMAKQLVARAAATVSPSKIKKAVTPDGAGYVARYTEVDTTAVETELIHSTGKSGGKYIGSIKYREMQYECRGKNQSEALDAPCERVKVRRMNELVRYDGKWVF